MANVIHRATLRFHRTVNEPDFPEPEYKWNPDMSGVAGVDARYWKAPADWDAVGAGPVAMTQAEQDAVNAADVAARRAAAQVAAKALIDDLEDSHARAFRNLARVVMASLVETRNTVNALIAETGSNEAPLTNRDIAALKAAWKSTIDSETSAD